MGPMTKPSPSQPLTLHLPFHFQLPGTLRAALVVVPAMTGVLPVHCDPNQHCLCPICRRPAFDFKEAKFCHRGFRSAFCSQAYSPYQRGLFLVMLRKMSRVDAIPAKGKFSSLWELPGCLSIYRYRIGRRFGRWVFSIYSSTDAMIYMYVPTCVVVRKKRLYCQQENQKDLKLSSPLALLCVPRALP